MKDFPTDSTGIDFLKIELNSYLHFFLKNEVNLDETMWEMWGKKIKALEVLKETMDEFSSFGIAQSFLRQHWNQKAWRRRWKDLTAKKRF